MGNLYDIAMGTALKSTAADEYAVEIATSPNQRDTVMAFILSKCTDEDIKSSLGLSQQTIDSLKKLFYDESCIRSKLDHIEYIRRYTNTEAQDEGRLLIRIAIDNGPFALMDKLSIGHECPKINMKAVTEKLFATAISTGLMARGNSLRSEENRQALKWFQTATQLISSYGNMEKNIEDTEDAIVAIERRKLLHRPDELGIVRSEIMH